ncbi:hypothetical protein DFJ74DRAFT_20497 [Hyaloraphidium curvatum]|nr:hypothetical protein DFJ74DRAFT_20497 [Hyaloraphidium curvatum]
MVDVRLRVFLQQVASLLGEAMFIPVAGFESLLASRAGPSAVNWADLVEPGTTLDAFLRSLAPTTELRVVEVDGDLYLHSASHDRDLVGAPSSRKRVHALVPRGTRLHSIGTLFRLYLTSWDYNGDSERFRRQVLEEHESCCTAGPSDTIMVDMPRRFREHFGAGSPQPGSSVARRDAGPPPGLVMTDDEVAVLNKRMLHVFAELKCLYVPAEQFQSHWPTARWGRIDVDKFVSNQRAPKLAVFLELYARHPRSDCQFFYIASAKKGEGRTAFFGPRIQPPEVLGLDDFYDRVHALMPAGTVVPPYVMRPLYAKTWTWDDSEQHFMTTIEDVHPECCVKQNKLKFSLNSAMHHSPVWTLRSFLDAREADRRDNARSLSPPPRSPSVDRTDSRSNQGSIDVPRRSTAPDRHEEVWDGSRERRSAASDRIQDDGYGNRERRPTASERNREDRGWSQERNRERQVRTRSHSPSNSKHRAWIGDEQPRSHERGERLRARDSASRSHHFDGKEPRSRVREDPQPRPPRAREDPRQPPARVQSPAAARSAAASDAVRAVEPARKSPQPGGDTLDLARGLAFVAFLGQPLTIESDPFANIFVE